MKKIILFGLLCMGTLGVQSQEIRALDASPLDLAIFRPNGQGYATRGQNHL